jgi:hypothetical protein
MCTYKECIADVRWPGFRCWGKIFVVRARVRCSSALPVNMPFPGRHAGLFFQVLFDPVFLAEKAKPPRGVCRLEMGNCPGIDSIVVRSYTSRDKTSCRYHLAEVWGCETFVTLFICKKITLPYL